MENSNESQDQMSTSPTLTGSNRRPVAVENIHVESTELLNAAGADQVSNNPGDVVAPLGADVIGDMNCEEDTEMRQQEPQVNGNQPPVCSKPQPSEQENVSLKQLQDGEKRSEHRCIICKINVLVFGCCQRTAHDECLHACDLSLTNCNCFQREKTIKRIDYPVLFNPDTPTSKRKQPVHHDDLSETWEDHPLQTHERHSKVESLFCYLCNTEEVFIMPSCCDAHYHYHCICQYIVNRYTTCPHCQGPLQPIPQMNNPLRTPPGDRSGGGGDDSGSNGEGGGGGGGGEGAAGGGAAGGAAEGAAGGAAGGGGRGHHGRRVGVNALGENNLRGGADIQGGGDGEGESENMEGDEDEVQLSVLQAMLLRHFLSNQSEGDGVGDDGRGGDSGSNGEGGGEGGGGEGGGEGGGAAGGAARGAAEGAAGGGGRGHHGRRVGVNALGENNLRGGADIQGGGDGEGESENIEGDEDDPGGGGDDDGGGGGNAGGSPLPLEPPLDLLFQQLLLLGMSPLLFPPPADDGDEEEYYERRVDDQDHYEGEEE